MTDRRDLAAPSGAGVPGEPLGGKPLGGVTRHRVSRPWGQRLGSAALLIAGLTLAARLAGFVRVLVFSSTVGSGCLGTLYLSANQIPNVIFDALVGGGLAAAMVPGVAALLATGRREEADRLTAALGTWVVTVMAGAALVLALAAPLIAGLVTGPVGPGCAWAPGVATAMVRIFAVQLVFYGLGVVLTGALQARGAFAGPALAPLLSSLVVIATYGVTGVLIARLGRDLGPSEAAHLPPGRLIVTVLAGGTTLGVLALSLPLLRPLLRARAQLRPRWRFPAGSLAPLLNRGVAALSGVAAQQVAVVTALLLAARVGGLATGTFTTWQYAQTIYLLPYAVLLVPVVTTTFTRLSNLAALDDAPAFAATSARAWRAVLIAGVLGAVAVTSTAPLVQVFFRAWDAQGSAPALNHLGAALTVLGPGVLAWGLVTLSARVFAAKGAVWESGLVLVVAWLGAALGSLLGVSLLRSLGRDGAFAALIGVAAGTSLALALGAGVAALLQRRLLGAAALAGGGHCLLWAGAPGVLAAGVGHGLAGWFAARLLTPGPGGVVVSASTPRAGLAGLAALAAVGVVLLALALWLLLVPSAMWLSAHWGRPSSPGAVSRESDPPEAGRDSGTVLHLCGPAEGGIAAQLAAQVRELPGLGWSARVITAPVTARALELAAAAESGSHGGVPVETLWPSPGSGRGARLVGFVRLLGIVRQRARGVAVLHAHGHQAGLVATLALSGLGPGERAPLVVSWHNAQLARGLRGRLGALAERRQVHAADLVTGASRDLTARALILGAARAETAEVAAPTLQAAPPLRAGLPPQPGLPPQDGAGPADSVGARVPPGARLVLTVARIAPQKDLDTLISAAARVTRDAQGSPVSWVVVGGGDLALGARLRARAAELKAPVVWVGPQPDVHEWLARAEVFVLTSTWEARSLAAQEAMGAGLPIVATAVGGLVDLLEGVAEFVPVSDPAAVARAVRTLLDDPVKARRLGASALAAHARLATEDEVAREWSRRYSSLRRF